MNQALVILAACATDMVIGDPHGFPHPVRVIGKAINLLERLFRGFVASAAGLRAAGVVMVLMIVLPVYYGTALLVSFLSQVGGNVSHMLGLLFIVYLAATTIATKDLLKSAQSVISAVENKDLDRARKLVSMIVGRDTQSLTDKGVLRATIETLAENLSDGVVAPLFYLALGGLPLAMAYKAINTLDSMVGYKNEQYRDFGWAGARLDDLANYLPARISGILIVASIYIIQMVKRSRDAQSAARSALRVMRADGRKHPSPNSGVPEAAMAGALNLQLGGPSTYGGVVSNKPFIGDGGREDFLAASHESMAIVKTAFVLAVIFAVAAAALRGQG
jgi:adenosylcobinamide-phosphate synthase